MHLLTIDDIGGGYRVIGHVWGLWNDFLRKPDGMGGRSLPEIVEEADAAVTRRAAELNAWGVIGLRYEMTSWTWPDGTVWVTVLAYGTAITGA